MFEKLGRYIFERYQLGKWLSEKELNIRVTQFARNLGIEFSNPASEDETRKPRPTVSEFDNSNLTALEAAISTFLEALSIGTSGQCLRPNATKNMFTSRLVSAGWSHEVPEDDDSAFRFNAFMLASVGHTSSFKDPERIEKSKFEDYMRILNEYYKSSNDDHLFGEISKFTFNGANDCYVVISHLSFQRGRVTNLDVLLALPGSLISVGKEVMEMSYFGQIFHTWAGIQNSNIGILSDGRFKNMSRDGVCTRFTGLIPNQDFITNCENLGVRSPSAILVAQLYEQML